MVNFHMGNIAIAIITVITIYGNRVISVPLPLAAITATVKATVTATITDYNMYLLGHVSSITNDNLYLLHPVYNIK